MKQNQFIIYLSGFAAAIAVLFLGYRTVTSLSDGRVAARSPAFDLEELPEEEADSSKSTPAVEGTASETDNADPAGPVANTGADSTDRYVALATETSALADAIVPHMDRIEPLTIDHAEALERILASYEPTIATDADRKAGSNEPELVVIADLMLAANYAAVTLTGDVGPIDQQLEDRLRQVVRAALTHRSAFVVSQTLFGLRKFEGEPGNGVDKLPEFHPIIGELRNHPADRVAFMANLVELPSDKPSGDKP